MIPEQLTIEGLYSYQSRQTIDFKTLTEAGLFGIFGAVGSGKSSILEAISFVLYGETERLNARDKRAYNMMNLKSKRSYIEFDFRNHENRLFRATREYKRNSKNFDDVKPSSSVFYEFKNEVWEPIEHTNAEPILGLNYSNFKRTIIIPQGQFKEFLELGAKDRTTMMKEIFQLHRFDLYDKASALNKKNESELEHLSGQLSGFETLSEERILTQKSLFNDLEKQVSDIQIQFNRSKETLQHLTTLKLDFATLKEKKNNFNALKDNKQHIEAQQSQLSTYETTYHNFHQLLQSQSQLLREKEMNTEKYNLQEKNRSHQQVKLNHLVSQIEILQPQFDQLPTKRTEEKEGILISQIKTFESEIQHLKSRTKKGVKTVEEVKNLVETIKTNIANKEDYLQNLTSNQVHPKILIDVSNWFNEYDLYQNQIQTSNANQSKIESSLDSLATELKALKLDLDHYPENINKQLQSSQSEKKKIEEKINQLRLQQKLSHYTEQLKNGESCPVCGATSHPKIAQLDNNEEQLNLLTDRITANDQEQSALVALRSTIDKLLFQKQNYHDQLTTEASVLAKLEEQLTKHRTTFVWNQFEAENKADFNSKKEKYNAIEEDIQREAKNLVDLRKELDTQLQERDKYSAALQKFEVDEAQKQTQISHNKSHLLTLNFTTFEAQTEAEIHAYFSQLKKDNDHLESNFQQLSKQHTEITLEIKALSTTLQFLEDQSSELQERLQHVKQNITTKQVLQNDISLETVQNILAINLDIPKVREEIQAFNIKYEILNNSITELENKLQHVSFDEQLLTKVEQENTQLEQTLLDITAQHATTLQEIDRLETEFKKKENLLKQQAQLNKRGEMLKIMTNLFKGAGFVEYVSSIYLKQLCEQANTRFHRMTRNQLSLQLNENNDFEIIDYLNEGRSRSVKTLSGGQAFQVSLSLALALAESVQANAKADRNFFFIDEGFGTQDTDSVNIVFETLMNLQKENRIVGIISHVEELKERIPSSLTIEKDEEKGSQILR